MKEVRDILHILNDVTNRYGLKTLYLDFTDITLMSRIGFSSEVFIQIYVNIKKDKINMALVVADERVYGIDKEGGSYHEHPFEKPPLHVPIEPIKIEDFIVRSLEFLKRMKLM